MLTLRGVYKDGQVTIIDEIPFEKARSFDVLVTFLDEGNDFVVLPTKEYRGLVNARLLTIRELEMLKLISKVKALRKSQKSLKLLRELPEIIYRSSTTSLKLRIELMHSIRPENWGLSTSTRLAQAPRDARIHGRFALCSTLALSANKMQ